jgi:hypothetical protein
MTTLDQQAALEKASVPLAYFVAMYFRNSTQRVCNFNKTFSWGGFDWLGLGDLGSISEIKASEKVEPNPVLLTLNIAKPEWLALGIGPVEEYRGLPVKIYQCPLNPDYTLIDTPMLSWDGDMDVVAASADGESGQLQMRCEPHSKKLRRRNVLRVNAAQQKLIYPTDTGFDYQADLLANPQTWLSRRFQQI